ncbi:TolC family protein, partial [candidate division KSB1 bacterium]|nr:TolC family protein [candidate division KSB1 bacterium]
MRKIIFLFLLSTSALAQISLQECVRTALTHNPGLQIAKAAADLAREDQRQAGASMLPSLDFSGSYRRQSSVPELSIDPIELPFGGGTFTPFPNGGMQLGTLDNYDFRLTLTQPLFAGFRLRNRQRASEALQLSKELEVSRSRSELIYKVASAYAGVLKAQQFRAIAENARQQVETHLRDVQVLLEQGLVRRDELLKVQVKRSEAELGLVRAQNSVSMTRVLLENVIGRSLADSADLMPMTVDTAVTINQQASLRMAIENRPELQALVHTAEATWAGKKIAQGAYFPSLAAFGTFAYGKPGLDFINKEWMDYWIVGVGAEWNLWNWGKTRSQVQQAEIRVRTINESERQVRDAITLDVTQACLQLQEAQKRAAVAAQMEKQAQESFRVTEWRYQQGQASHTDFFDAQSEWTRAQLHKAEAEIEIAL